MIAVIGLAVRFASVSNIDAFDAHLYSNKPIAVNAQHTLQKAVADAEQVIEQLLTVNHLSAKEVDLLLLEDPSTAVPSSVDNTQLGVALQQSSLCQACFSISSVFSVNEALTKVQSLNASAFKMDTLQPRVALVIAVNQLPFDGVAALLLCAQSLLEQSASPFNLHHSYAQINAASQSILSAQEASLQQSLSEHIEGLLCVDNGPQLADIESVITGPCDSVFFKNAEHSRAEPIAKHKGAQQGVSRSDHQQAWLAAFQSLSQQHQATKMLNQPKSTLLTAVECVNTASANFDALLSVVAAVLCVDQRYRIGCKQALVEYSDPCSRSEQFTDWQNSPFYYLPHSSSYLSTALSTPPRRVLVSYIGITNSAMHHQLISVSEASKQATHGIKVANGYLAQQAVKPAMFTALSMDQLIALLKQTWLELNTRSKLSDSFNFVDYVMQKNQLATQTTGQLTTDSAQQQGFCVVLLASSMATLSEQVALALTGVAAAYKNRKAWKTPAGSYFSGQAMTPQKSPKPVTFIYPGVGALYVNMGNDLLRLFPQCWQPLSKISDNLAESLQDQLMTPRLIAAADFATSLTLQKLLRAELANIAEAGVSYACLLTHIFQQQLGLKATSAAGYSMGEVSMFAALDCWQAPQLLNQRFRRSGIFTEQLSGPLKRLQTAPSATAERPDAKTPLWESYHLKAGLVQVQSIIADFPNVYITIINTPESLVIAGDPQQCLALAKQLKVRAMALNVHNIIHCELAKSEYKNMLQLYSLAIKQKISCQLFSSSCYLPVPITEKAIAVSISKCLTELVDFPRLIKKIATTGETVFIEMGAGKSLSTWIERILKKHPTPITCLSVNQKKSDDYSAILKAVAPLLSLGYAINLQPFFNGTLIRPVEKMAASVSVL